MKKTENIASAALILASSILLSRLLGYAREMLVAYKFGAGSTTDAFYAAFQIPDLLNYFLAGGALSIAFIPLYNKTLSQNGKEAAEDLTAVVLGTMGLLAAILTALLWWQAPALVLFQFPKFAPDTAILTVSLTRIVLPAQVFFITGGIIQAVLLANKNFSAAALAPLVYNACTILGGLLLGPVFGIAGFSIGTLAGSILGPFLLPLLYARGHIPLKARIAPLDKGFLVYLALAAPLMFGQTLLTLDEWYGRWFGALLAEGSVAQISYARRLMQVPIAVIGQAIGAAALPTLSLLWAECRVKELHKTLETSLRMGISLAILAGGAFLALARPIVGLVYEHGAFTAVDAEIVALLTCTFALAVPGWIMQQISVRAFYARGDTWRPMVLGTIISALAIPLYMHMSETGGVKGIATAGAIAMTVSALATLAYARRLHGGPKIFPLVLSAMSATLITLPAVPTAWWAMHLRARLLPLPASLDQVWESFVNLAVGGLGFAAVVLPGIFLIGDEELSGFVAKTLKRLLGFVRRRQN
jgi:putative peptidoglycan lipid II flippase